MTGIISLICGIALICQQIEIHFLNKRIDNIETWKPFMEATELMEGIKNQEKVEELWKQGKLKELKKL